MCLVHLTLLAGARRQERPLPKLVKAFVNKRHQYFGLEPMHTSYEYSLSRIKQEPSKIGIKVHSTFSLHPIGARTRSCNSDTLGLHQEQTYPRKGNLEELLLFDPRALD